jgi:endo-1,4-beta-xylanase
MPRILNVCLLLFLSSCALHKGPLSISDHEFYTLKQAADSVGMNVGVAVSYQALKNDLKYRQFLSRELSSITPENSLKMEIIRPAPDAWSLEEFEEILSFAQENNLQVRGHPLVWHRQLPKWLSGAEVGSEELQKIMLEHIETLVGRYKRQIKIWDVVNEAVLKDGSFRKSPWFKALGKDYIEKAFRAAHKANKNAKLFYNDYKISRPSRKFEAVYELLRELRERDVPVHGVGLQMHLMPGYLPSAAELSEVIGRFSDLGLEVHITELDQALNIPVTKEILEHNASTFAMAAKVCTRHSACTSIAFWGLGDHNSWIPQEFKGLSAGTLLDEDYQPKPSYYAVKEAFLIGAQ